MITYHYHALSSPTANDSFPREDWDRVNSTWRTKAKVYESVTVYFRVLDEICPFCNRLKQEYVFLEAKKLKTKDKYSRWWVFVYQSTHVPNTALRKLTSKFVDVVVTLTGNFKYFHHFNFLLVMKTTKFIKCYNTNQKKMFDYRK